MFDAFIRFANGIISHEASPHGGGGGGQPGYRGRAPTPLAESEPSDDLHLDADSLTISHAFWRSRAAPAEIPLPIPSPDPSPP